MKGVCVCVCVDDIARGNGQGGRARDNARANQGAIEGERNRGSALERHAQNIDNSGAWR